ncbi:uncharacterized protein LOC141789157 isoform X1 [Halichoeres trimaculatus]|uniref:uncharacterized protein LOC141789157 isoform X1 n=1 Tax=Halichoeres trimaculatus TaxID=147232 RepID=UPI003D9FAD60
MKMWRKELTLMLLTVALMVISGEHLVILNRTQTTVVHPTGSSLTLGCSLETKKLERYRMSLYFNPSGCTFTKSHKIYELFRVANDTKINENKRQLQTNPGISTGDTGVLKITMLNATEADSGWYFCTLIAEIPDLGNESTNGTQVIITKSLEHTTNPSVTIVTGKQETMEETVTPTPSSPPTDWWLWILIGVSAVILIILLVVCILMRRSYSRRRAAADPIYANTHRRSPRPGMPVENLKTVSSSQNLRNPSPAIYGNDRRRNKQ